MRRLRHGGGDGGGVVSGRFWRGHFWVVLERFEDIHKHRISSGAPEALEALEGLLEVRNRHVRDDAGGKGSAARLTRVMID